MPDKNISSGKKKLNETDYKAKRELKGFFLQLTDNDRSNMIVVLEKLSRILPSKKKKMRLRQRADT